MAELRKLGASGIMVSPIGLGAWQYSQGKGAGVYWRTLGQDAVRAAVRESIENGVSWIDTAEVYGWGRSEESVADALAAAGIKPGAVLVATKWFPLFRLARSIERSFPERLARLHGYPIALHQIHMPTGLSPIPSQMRAMARLHERGLIGAVGVSNFSAAQMRLAHATLRSLGIPLASNQVRFSLLDRHVEGNGVLETARELGVSIIAYSPLAQGLLTGVYHADPARVRGAGMRRFTRDFSRAGLERSRPVIDAVREIGVAHRATPSQVALSWLIRAHGDTVVAIPGASSAEQARLNASSMRLDLSAEEIRRLSDVSRPGRDGGEGRTE